jgi:class 3 adenylate cyclase/tetratricopeptide (TPR) repeat protein
MKCPRCAHENPGAARFCEGCAAPLILTCSSCGAFLSARAKFCHACGDLVSGAPPVTRSPEDYTPKHLAERILTSKAALEGERKQITVLFADLKGSMELLADRDPEEARKILDPILAHMMEAVHHYEGTVNQVMGDGIMALFGAPIAHEDHAVRACYAALRMQRSVQKHAGSVRSSHGIETQIRVGINSGDVVVRSVGSDLRMDYTAVGQTTHLAARMEQLADPGSVLITADVLRRVEGWVDVRPLGPVKIKGLSEPAEVYEITGTGPVHTRLQAVTARGLTRFVGRETELEELGKAAKEVQRGHGQIVAVVGEPGVGKSRLFYEFTQSHRRRGWVILEAGSVSYGRATPYLPVIDLLKACFRIEAQDDERRISEKVRAKLLTLDRALEPTLPALLALLDVPVENGEWQDLDPPQRRARTLQAVNRVLLCESQVSPLALVLEDLHWIDSESEALLDSLVDGLPSSRMLLLVNYRPEYRHGWASKTYYTQLRIDPLPPANAEEFLEVLLGSHAGLRELKRLLIGRTEGNPFFLEESVRALVETGGLAGERNAYRLARPLEAIQVPATVQAVLAARIDRLPPEEKGLLQTAAVIGKDAPFALLAAIAEQTELDLRRTLGHLEAGEFLYETKFFAESQYTFKHALTHEVAYQSLLHERRRALHAGIVRVIEKLYEDRLSEWVERLAHHAIRGEIWEKAVDYYRQAGAKAFLRSAYREAVASFDQARRALQRLPETRETLEQAVDLRFELRNSLLPLGEHSRYAEHLQEAERLASRLGDQHRLGWLAAYMTAYLYLMGDQHRALDWGTRALTIAERLDDRSLQVPTNTWVGQVHYYRGEYRRAATFFGRNIKTLGGALAYERFGLPQLPSVHSRTCLVWCLAELGEFTDGIRNGQEGLRIAESVEHPLTQAVACSGLGTLYLRMGRLGDATSVLERGLELIRTWNVLLWFPRIASALGVSYALAGRPGEGLPLLEQAVEQAADMGLMGGHAMLLAYLAEGYSRARRPDEALATGRRALALAQDHKEVGHEAWALCLLGEIAMRCDPPDADAAEEHGRRGLALADTLDMSPLSARIHLGLGRVNAQVGPPATAREHLTIALARFREMEMSALTAEAGAELARLR